MRRFLEAFPLLWPPRKKRTAEAEKALDQGLVIPTHLPQIPHLLQLQRKKTRTTTTQVYIIVATKEKADRATEALDQGLIIPPQLLQVRTAKLKNHKYKLRFVQIPAFVFKSKS